MPYSLLHDLPSCPCRFLPHDLMEALGLLHHSVLQGAVPRPTFRSVWPRFINTVLGRVSGRGRKPSLRTLPLICTTPKLEVDEACSSVKKDSRMYRWFHVPSGISETPHYVINNTRPLVREGRNVCVCVWGGGGV